MNKEIRKLIGNFIDKEPCYIRVGSLKSLSIGFGRLVESHQHVKGLKYAEWDVGSYDGFWRIMEGNKIICLKDNDEDIACLNEKVNKIKLGSLSKIEMITDIDVRLRFNSGIHIDFIAAISDDDEHFHIFCPENKYVELASTGKWILGKSNTPWK